MECTHLSTGKWRVRNKNELPAPIYDVKGSRRHLRMVDLDALDRVDDQGLELELGLDRFLHDLFPFHGLFHVPFDWT